MTRGVPRPAAADTGVVFVHGLWFTGHEAFWLRRRLARELGAADLNFPYRSVRAPLAESARALGAYIARSGFEKVHLVGHSLGGIVILKLFELAASLPAVAPGRVVLLGSPIQGSRAAASLARIGFGRKILGRAIAEGVLATRPRIWPGSRDLGIIAGRAAVGLGGLVARLERPNDGVVQVDETRLAGAREHLVLDVSHSGLLFSRAVVAQTAAFLRDGKFLPAAQPPPSNRRSR